MAEVHCTMLCLLVAMTLPWSARASDFHQAQYKRNSGMDDQQLTTAALFQTSARSTLHCGIQCSQLDGCSSYTYIAVQPSSCRGYDVAMTSPNATDSAVPAAGAKTFENVIAHVDECSSNPCENGGACKDQLSGYLCQCAPGYTGLQCQTDVDECSSNPCENGGTCTDQLNGYLCQCAPDYVGLQCQTAWLESPCSADSDCPVTNSECFKWKCLCTPGYYYSTGGRTCLNDSSACDCGPQCDISATPWYCGLPPTRRHSSSGSMRRRSKSRPHALESGNGGDSLIGGVRYQVVVSYKYIDLPHAHIQAPVVGQGGPVTQALCAEDRPIN